MQENLIKVGHGGRQGSQDDVLIGTGNFDSLGDSTWDYGVSNQEPVRMMLDFAQKQKNEAKDTSAFQPGRRNNKQSLLESSVAEDIDVDMLLQTFSSTGQGHQAGKVLDDSIDETIYDMIESGKHTTYRNACWPRLSATCFCACWATYASISVAVAELHIV